MSRVWIALVAAGLAVSLTGCGDDGTPKSAAPATVTATVTASASPTTSSSPSDEPSSVVSLPTGLPSIVVPTGGIPESSPPTSQPSNQPGGAGKPPRSYIDALEHISAAEQEHPSFVQARRWTSPSGNIYCVTGGGGIPPSCEIGEGAVRDPAVCGPAPTPYVGRLEISGGRARAICNTDTIRTGDRVPSIPYGTVAGSAQVICLSEEIGVTCIATQRQVGFFLRRGQYLLFN
jgi:hypothetical protein